MKKEINKNLDMNIVKF